MLRAYWRKPPTSFKCFAPTAGKHNFPGGYRTAHWLRCRAESVGPVTVAAGLTTHLTRIPGVTLVDTVS